MLTISGQPFYTSKDTFVRALPESNELFRIAMDGEVGKAWKAYTAFPNPQDYRKFVSKVKPENRCFYELGSVNGDQPERFKLDFDLSKTETRQEVFDFYKVFTRSLLEVSIKKVFTDLFAFNPLYKNYRVPTATTNLTFMTASTVEKISWHVIVSGFAFRDHKHAKRMRNRVLVEVVHQVKKLRSHDDFVTPLPKAIDPSPYGQFQTFRMEGCIKIGRPLDTALRQVDVNHLKDPQLNLFTVVGEKDPILDIPEETHRTPTTYDSVPIKLTPNALSGLELLVDNLSCERATEYGTWRNVGFALKNVGDLYDLFDKFSAKSDKYNSEGVRKFWESITRKTTGKALGIGSLLKWLKEDCKCQSTYSKIIKYINLGSRKYFVKRYVKQVKPAWAKDGVTYAEKFVKTLPDGDVCIQSYLGTGKTTQIERVISKDKRVLVLSPRIKFATSIAARLRIPCYINMSADNLMLATRIVCSVESLHKLSCDEFDVVILDEVESILNQLFSPTVTYRDEVLQRFQTVILNAGRVIGADAFLSDRTVKCLSLIRGKKITRVQNTLISEKRMAVRTKDIHTEALKKLKEGKNIFFVFSSRNALLMFENRLKNANLGIIYRAYHSSADDNNKDFIDVNKSWLAYNAILTTSVITVGVNFDVEHFDYIFLDASPNGPIVRDLFQSIMRVRHIQTNELWYQLEDKNVFSSTHPMTIKEMEASFTDMEEFLVSCDTTRTQWIELAKLYADAEEKCSRYYFTQLFNAYLDFCGYRQAVNETESIIQTQVAKEETKERALPRVMSDAEMSTFSSLTNKTAADKSRFAYTCFLKIIGMPTDSEDINTELSTRGISEETVHHIIEGTPEGKNIMEWIKNVKCEKKETNKREVELCLGFDRVERAKIVLEFMESIGVPKDIGSKYEGPINLEKVDGIRLRKFLEVDMKARFRGKGDGTSAKEKVANLRTLFTKWNGDVITINTRKNHRTETKTCKLVRNKMLPIL